MSIINDFQFELDQGGSGKGPRKPHVVSDRITSVDAGPMTAEHAELRTGNSDRTATHITKRDAGEISVDIEMGDSGELLKWIAGAWGGTTRGVGPRNGSLRYMDNIGMDRLGVQLDFYDALPTEVSLPSLDVGSSDIGMIKAKLQPSYVETKLAKHVNAGLLRDVPSPKVTPITNHFRFIVYGHKIPDIQSISNIRKVDGLSMKMKVEKIHYPGQEHPTLVPIAAELPKEVSLTVPMHAATPWIAWHRSMIERGVNTDKRFVGFLSYMHQVDKKKQVPVFGIGFDRMVLTDVKYSTAKAGEEALVTLKLAFETLKLTTDKSATGEKLFPGRK